jgi:hypothetical protein
MDRTEATKSREVANSAVNVGAGLALLAADVSALSEARFHKSVKSGRGARSIEPFEGGRWRLRRMRASGCTDLTAMGIESFFVCSLLILLGLGKLEKTENRS